MKQGSGTSSRRTPSGSNEGIGWMMKGIFLAILIVTLQTTVLVQLQFIFAPDCSFPTSVTSLPTTTTVETKPQSKYEEVAALDNGSGAAGVEQELAQWLKKNPKTPGATYVRYLQENMHKTATMEGERIQSCRQKDKKRCFSGQTTGSMPLVKDRTVEQMYKFPGTDHNILYLGTDLVCLPLLLAGASVPSDQVIVELGPFVGLSSRCMATGLANTPDGTAGSRMHVFDSWEGSTNYKAITASMPWVKEEHPEYTEDSSDFLWLWKMVVSDVYPQAKTYQGYITPTSLDTSQWGNRDIAVLSIDSIKDWFGWKQQLAGLGEVFLKKGAIFCALDFTFTDQPNLLYGCLRDYMIPVYTSWTRGEHWIFVVTETIPLDFPGQCMKDLLNGNISPSNEQLAKMQRRMLADVQFLQNLSGQPSPGLEKESEALWDSLYKYKLGQEAPPKFWRRFSH